MVPKGEFPFRNCIYTKDVKPTTFLVNPLRRKIGVEIECGVWDGSEATGSPQSYRIQDPPVHCFFDHDGSVEPSKLELVVSPMLGDELPATLTSITAQMSKHGAEAGPTTGYHVHVDAMGATPEELRRILFAWGAIEPWVYGTLVSKARIRNKYCIPIRHEFDLFVARQWFAQTGAFNIMNMFYGWLYGLQMPDPKAYSNTNALAYTRAKIKDQLVRLKEHKYQHAARRKAINFHAWMMRGTVEFRLKEGTVDPLDILMWPQWCGWFVEKCITTFTDEEVLRWYTNPPTLLELTGRLGGGPQARHRMPSQVMAWAEAKCRKK